MRLVLGIAEIYDVHKISFLSMMPTTREVAHLMTALGAEGKYGEVLFDAQVRVRVKQVLLEITSPVTAETRAFLPTDCGGPLGAEGKYGGVLFDTQVRVPVSQVHFRFPSPVSIKACAFLSTDSGGPLGAEGRFLEAGLDRAQWIHCCTRPCSRFRVSLVWLPSGPRGDPRRIVLM